MKNADMPAIPCKIDLNRRDETFKPHQFDSDSFITGGITKREYFAARAPSADSGFIENFIQNNKDNEYLVCNDAFLTSNGRLACIAAFAHTYADAMCAYGDEK